MAFIKKSPTAFHVVNNFSKMLESAGFVKLNEMDRWEIKPNGKINRNEQGIFLTYIQIKRLLSLPISDEEAKKERIMMG